MIAIADLISQGIPASDACEALGMPRATYYRRQRPPPVRVDPAPRPTPPRALSPDERQEVLDVLHNDRFLDRSPAQVWATLLEEEQTYLCSPRTMYRILAGEKEVRERRNQLRRPQYTKPELVATGPNQVWTWDLTKMRGPEKWTYYHLYVVLDLYSRLVVAWMLAHRESGDLAKDLFSQAYDQQKIQPGQLTVHNDRGSAPTAKTLYQLHADLGVECSVSRPHVSNDNPYSEAHFKTFKYAPGYPDRFGSYEDGLMWCRAFFPWYNQEHRHSGIKYLTPASVHEGRGQAILTQRHHSMMAAYAARPERFPNGPPRCATLPGAVWINPPEDRSRVETHTEKLTHVDCAGENDLGDKRNEAGPEGPAPSVLSPAQRSGCSSAEPYPLSRHAHHTAGAPL
jgi:putative transposase